MDSKDSSYQIRKSPIGHAYQTLEECMEACVPIYDVFHRNIFKKLDGYMAESITPLWILEAGNDEESKCNKQQFEILCKAYDCILMNQMLYYNALVSTKIN